MNKRMILLIGIIGILLINGCNPSDRELNGSVNQTWEDCSIPFERFCEDNNMSPYKQDRYLLGFQPSCIDTKGELHYYKIEIMLNNYTVIIGNTVYDIECE